jgi:hypothetical protein
MSLGTAMWTTCTEDLVLWKEKVSTIIFSCLKVSRTHTIKYEIGVDIQTGNILWVFGGVPGAVSDSTLLRISGLLDQMEPGEFLLGDKGYHGMRGVITPEKRKRLSAQEELDAAMINEHRVTVERTIGRFKFFQILSHKWRHSRGKHRLMFSTIAHIVNIDLRYRPLFQ